MSIFEQEVSLLNVKYIMSAKPLAKDEFLQADKLGCDLTLPLDNKRTTQTFTASEPGLIRMDILLAPGTSTSEDSIIQFRLWRDEIDGDLVAETEILAFPTDVPSSYTIYFSPGADSAGQRFVWGITGEEEASVCLTGTGNNLVFAAYGARLIARAEIDDIWIYGSPNTLPCAYQVHYAETVPAAQKFDRLVDTNFNFYHSLFLTAPLPGELSSQLAAPPVRSLSQVEITDYSLLRVELNVTMRRPGIFLLADTNYPGWEAIVNGTEQEIVEANSILRGIILSTGTHSIIFQFRPTTLYCGIGFASLTIVVAIVIILVTNRRKKYETVHLGGPSSP